MKTPPIETDRAWLANPVVTPLGEIKLAGLLRDAARIDPRSKRILGDYALVFIVKGRAFYCDDRTRDAPQTLSAGNAIIVFPEIAHAYGPLGRGEKSKGWTQIYFVFNGPQFDLLRARGILSPESPVLRPGAPDFWSQRLKDVLAGATMRGAGGPLRAVGKLAQALLEMTAAAHDDKQPGHEEWLEKALRLLGRQGASGWLPPREGARAAGMGYDNFRKQFSSQTGESPGAYQKRRRIECACAALYHGKSGLKEIAAELDFCDEFHFSKVFKQVTGLAPSAYRKKMRGV